ncbi:ankyrin repeat-containing domain protein [Russula ochroleuca]|uniref:Ankyrin repeat-containing domain protein n=1 Tax=Russula ochroleuca TaxID=152965 RepID=A0A9P5N1J5_9AGAM|nr:ankyrin repeat-containing domain protein [Russula ochroleuca]
MLIERGADVTAQNEDGETPLHQASEPDPPYSFLVHALAEVSCILLEQGADVNAQNNAGLTPFRLASQSKHSGDRRAQVLLQHGADPQAGDGTGEEFSLGIFKSDSEMDLGSD